jgi:hypothetical protein
MSTLDGGATEQLRGTAARGGEHLARRLELGFHDPAEPVALQCATGDGLVGRAKVTKGEHRPEQPVGICVKGVAALVEVLSVLPGANPNPRFRAALNRLAP